jgi:hypothetical protein
VVNVDSWWDSLTHDRFAAVLELVLVAVSDDYMTLEVILKTLNEWGAEEDSGDWPARSAIPVSPPEVIRALRELIREGYLQPCLFVGKDVQFVNFQELAVNDVWFCATQKGVDAAKRIFDNE